MHKINTKGQVTFGSCIFNNKTSSLSPRCYEFIYVYVKNNIRSSQTNSTLFGKYRVLLLKNKINSKQVN
jgi:hypothetical protein